MKKILFLLMMILVVQLGFSQSKNEAYLSYIKEYQEIAIRQQKRHNIPASIILAQGLLESGAGRSRLAVNANNHFGIKCHDWTGDVIYHDDDERNECFRKYKKASDSFEDHSLFLVNRTRYQSLFSLNTTDYVAWAHGLKAAGYATDPAYAQKLINLIELYGLDEVDKGEVGEVAKRPEPARDQEVKEVRDIYKSNAVKLVVAAKGDTYASLAEELKISEKRLRKYNEVGKDMELKAGDMVYLAKKRKKASFANQIHVVREGESIYSISQIYGIQFIQLYKINNLPFEQGAYIGQIIKLR